MISVLYSIFTRLFYCYTQDFFAKFLFIGNCLNDMILYSGKGENIQMANYNKLIQSNRCLGNAKMTKIHKIIFLVLIRYIPVQFLNAENVVLYVSFICFKSRIPHFNKYVLNLITLYVHFSIFTYFQPRFYLTECVYKSIFKHFL